MLRRLLAAFACLLATSSGAACGERPVAPPTETEATYELVFGADDALASIAPPDAQVTTILSTTPPEDAFVHLRGRDATGAIVVEGYLSDPRQVFDEGPGRFSVPALARIAIRSPAPLSSLDVSQLTSAGPATRTIAIGSLPQARTKALGDDASCPAIEALPDVSIEAIAGTSARQVNIVIVLAGFGPSRVGRVVRLRDALDGYFRTASWFGERRADLGIFVVTSPTLATLGPEALPPLPLPSRGESGAPNPFHFANRPNMYRAGRCLGALFRNRTGAHPTALGFLMGDSALGIEFNPVGGSAVRDGFTYPDFGDGSEHLLVHGIAHELAHVFGGLADEYEKTSPVSSNDCAYLRRFPNVAPPSAPHWTCLLPGSPHAAQCPGGGPVGAVERELHAGCTAAVPCNGSMMDTSRDVQALDPIGRATLDRGFAIYATGRAPAEICNGIDDDLDGEIDEGCSCAPPPDVRPRTPSPLGACPPDQPWDGQRCRARAANDAGDAPDVALDAALDAPDAETPDADLDADAEPADVDASAAPVDDADVCAPEAGLPAPSCAGCDHGLCVPGTALAPRCNECSTKVCAVDEYCCRHKWTWSCVEKVKTVCGFDCKTI
jgi:hypothetical protein